MKNKLLSICIPTYNRKGFLQENIDSIIKQITPEFEELVEICVSDNASTDGTLELLEQYAGSNKNIAFRYTVNPQNLGPDRNFILAMKMGEGDYIWLMGSDDAIVEESIKNITDRLKGSREFGILLFNRIDCTKSMVPSEKRYWLKQHITEQYIDFSDKMQEAFYYANAVNLGALCTFISGYVFSKDILLKEPYDESYIGTGYSFLFYIYSYLKSGGKLHYTSQHYVYCRTGNTTLRKNDFASSPFRRYLLDYDGFIKIRNDFFAPDDINAPGFLNVLKVAHPFYQLFEMCAYSTKKEWADVVPKLKAVGWDDKELKVIKVVANFFVKQLFKLRRFLKDG